MQVAEIKAVVEKDDKNLLPLTLRNHIPNPFLRGLFRLVEKPTESALAIPQFNDIYTRTVNREPDLNFFNGALSAMRCSYEIVYGSRQNIPSDGPVVVVANHPFGGLDGVVLGALLSSARQDTRLLVNFLLSYMEGFGDWVFPVDPFNRPSSKEANFKGMRDTLKWLKAGGCLGTFPSGEVSHWDLKQRKITDPEWNPNTAGLIRRSQATVVPVFFKGNNSALFQTLGLIHPRLRTAMLPRELVRRTNWRVELAIGEPISWNRVKHFENDQELMGFLRMKTELLADRTIKRHSVKLRPTLPAKKPPSVQEIIDPIPSPLLKEEISRLDPNNVLIRQGRFKVILACASEIPNCLREIGRLREITFRMVNEGTGRSVDLDRFDLYYRHIFLWDETESKIAGAYRMGLSDQILSEWGKKGFYTSTLFHFKKSLFEHLNPALEMGRSFIAAEYQRKHAALGLLWKGIGTFVARNPQYNILFGPVSIDRGYDAVSKDLMIQFLRQRKRDPELAPKVKPKHPPQRRSSLKASEKKILGSPVLEIEDVSALVMEVERGSKGVPILLRHYLKLNARLLGFNVDPEFSNALDGLMVVDLLRTERTMLKNYLGVEGSQSFLDFHQKKEQNSETPTNSSPAGILAR